MFSVTFKVTFQVMFKVTFKLNRTQALTESSTPNKQVRVNDHYDSGWHVLP